MLARLSAKNIALPQAKPIRLCGSSLSGSRILLSATVLGPPVNKKNAQG